LKTYAEWGRKFQTYLADKPPEGLSSLDVKEYLTHLAVKQGVASSTQNQAFNTLLFLFRHVLKKDFGDQRDVTHAKKSEFRSFGEFWGQYIYLRKNHQTCNDYAIVDKMGTDLIFDGGIQSVIYGYLYQEARE
jgi:hypothetical protein